MKKKIGVMSFGIILLNSKNQVVLVQRRHSVEFIEIIRGNYSSLEMLCHFCSLVTLKEKEFILKHDFREIWDQMNNNNKYYDKYYRDAHFKFYSNNVKFIIHDLPDTSLYNENEFCLPKGRKKNNIETEKCCAIREFREETGVSEEINISDTIFIEHFSGTNGKKYSTKYFVAKCNDITLKKYSDNEIQKVLFVDSFLLSKYARFYRNNLLDIFFKISDLVKRNKF